MVWFILLEYKGFKNWELGIRYRGFGEIGKGISVGGGRGHGEIIIAHKYRSKELLPAKIIQPN